MTDRDQITRKAPEPLEGEPVEFTYKGVMFNPPAGKCERIAQVIAAELGYRKGDTIPNGTFHAILSAANGIIREGLVEDD